MSLQDLVTENLAADADETRPTLWEKMNDEFSPQEALRAGQDATKSLSNNWTEPVAQFAVRLMYHTGTQSRSLGAEILVRSADAQSDPKTLPDLQKLLELALERVSLQAHTASADDALAWLEDNFSERDRLAAGAAGVKPETARRWRDGGKIAGTKMRKLFVLVRAAHEVLPLLPREDVVVWLETPSANWNKTPLQSISESRHQAIPYDVRVAIRELQSSSL